MEIVEFSDKYLNDIAECFKRNFEIMKPLDTDTIIKWMQPLINYSWFDDEISMKQPFKHGMVLIDDEKVIGYCGLVFSFVWIEGKKYKYVNPSTWAIDHEYSFGVFSAMNKMLELADIVGDFTPIEKVKKMCLEMYDFKYLDEEKFKFIPIPCFTRKLQKKIIKEAGEIEDKDAKKMYLDHEKYNVKCARIEYKNQVAFIFYKNYHSKIKMIKKVPFILVLDVINKDFVIENVHEIVWFLQKKEKAFLEIDGRFINHKKEVTGVKKITSNKRLIYSEVNQSPNISLLYSELAILDEL